MSYNNNYNNSFGVRILSKYFNVTLINSPTLVGWTDVDPSQAGLRNVSRDVIQCIVAIIHTSVLCQPTQRSSSSKFSKM